MTGTVIFIVVVLIFCVNVAALIFLSRKARQASETIYGSHQRLLGRVLMIIVAMGLVAGICGFFYSLYFVHTALKTAGTVIEMRELTDKETGSVSWAPTFQFQDASGVSHTVVSDFFSAPPEFHAGDRVTVLYRRNDPQNAWIDSFWHVWGFAALGGMLGSFTFSIGTLLVSWRTIISGLRGQPVTA